MYAINNVCDVVLLYNQGQLPYIAIRGQQAGSVPMSSYYAPVLPEGKC